MLLDAGDTLFGKPLSNQSEGALQIAAMNAMGYDAMALGLVDLGATAPVLTEHFLEADFAILTVNVGPEGFLPVQPYVLREVEGHTVAIIGATANGAQNASETVGVELEVENVMEVIPAVVAELRDQADVIIILSNLKQKSNISLAQEVPGIDVIIGTRDGGSPTKVQLIEGPEGKVVLHTAGRLGQYLALLHLHFDAQGRIEVYEGQGFVLTDKYADDPAMVELLQAYGLKP